MAASNVSLQGLMQLGDWMTGKRSEMQEAALEGERAKTGLTAAQTAQAGVQTEQAGVQTAGLRQAQSQSADTFKQQQWKQNHDRFWNSVLNGDSLDVANQSATDENGKRNNPYLDEVAPPGYVPVPHPGPDGKLGLTLRNADTGDYVDQTYFGDKNTPNHEFDPTQHIIPKSKAQIDKNGNPIAPPPNAWFMDANALAKMRVAMKGEPKPVQTVNWGTTGHYDESGKWVQDVEGKEKPPGYGFGAKESARQKARGYLDTLLQKENTYIDPMTKAYNDESSGERTEIADRYDKLLGSDKSGDPDYERLARTAINQGRSAYRKKDPYWMLPPKEKFLRQAIDEEAAAKKAQGQPQPGQPGAKSTSAQQPEPQSLDEAVAQETQREAMGGQKDIEAALAKNTARVTKEFPQARTRLVSLVRNGASRDTAINLLVNEFSSNLASKAAQDMLRQKLQEFAQPQTARPARAASPASAGTPPQPALPTTAAVGGAKGGVVTPMRDMEPGTGIPGSLSRPLQTARGGFRPRSY